MSLIAACLFAGVWVDDPAAPRGEFQRAVRFEQLGPRVLNSADAKRHGWKWAAPKINIENESFTVYVPKSASREQPVGLLVYLSPTPQGLMASRRLPTDRLIALLDQHRMAYVGANGAQNERNPLDRLQLALAAVQGMRDHYPIDDQRIVAAGLSGGGKMAAIIGRLEPKVFCGVIAICGVGFHRRAPVVGKRGYSYPHDMNLAPAAEKQAADRVKYVLVTGSNDFNRPPTLAYEGLYRKARFNTLLVDQEGLGHEIPDSETLDRCLQFVFANGDDRTGGDAKRSCE